MLLTTERVVSEDPQEEKGGAAGMPGGMGSKVCHIWLFELYFL